MKKFISLALTLAMVVSMVPMTAFAASDNRITGSATKENDVWLTADEAPNLVLENDRGDWKDEMTFELTLENAEFKYSSSNGDMDRDALGNHIMYINSGLPGEDSNGKLDASKENQGYVNVVKKTANTAVFTVKGVGRKGTEIHIPLISKFFDTSATVTIVPKQSQLSADTFTIGRGSEGGTITTIEKTVNFSDGDKVKDIFIEEVSANTLQDTTGQSEKYVSVQLSSGFKFSTVAGKAPKVEVVSGDNVGSGPNEFDVIPDTSFGTNGVKDDEFRFNIKGHTNSQVGQIKITNLYVYEDGADYGDVAKITVKGAKVDRTVLEVGTYSDYGLKLSSEDKELPVIYSGRMGAERDSDSAETLKVTFEETIIDSWLTSRKTTFKLPEGVKFEGVEVKKVENLVDPDETGKSLSKGDVETIILDAMKDGDEFSIPKDTIGVKDNEKAKIEMIFKVTAAADFTGDVEVKVEGSGVDGNDLSTTVATVQAPFTVTSKTNEVAIDYRNVSINDIVITEADAGLLKKDKAIVLRAENMTFENNLETSVEGDLTIDKVDVKNGDIRIKIDKASSSEPSVITLSNVQLYLDRTLPAGDYKLEAVPTSVYGDTRNGATGTADNDEGFFYNFVEDKDDYDGYKTAGFDVDSVVMKADFVKVVTAGRDQDDSTFTTKIVVPIGANEITAGDKKIALDSPAYITGKGYTMLPVRAITEALSGVATVRWDDSTKTCTISFGQRIISMTVGKDTMNINGVETALQAPPEITNERIFLPLRDLGYALGLNDSKISWDAATSTATLN